MASDPVPADASPTAADLVSADALPLFDGITTAGTAPASASLSGPMLQMSDLLDGGSGALSRDGGFVFFDQQSQPGNTIVRVMLEGADHQHLFDIGILPGGGTDLNSLLGLIAPGHDHG